MTPEEKHKFLWRSFDRPLRYVCQELKPNRVLEWGPGLSTSIIAATRPDAHIYTIEHNPKYFEKIRKLWDAHPNVTAELREIILKGGKSTGYITAPLCEAISLNQSYRKGRGAIDFASLQPIYDLIFVDGRFRYDCLNIANLLVKDTGAIVLHDTHRTNYHPAADLFAFRKQFDERRTWVLSNGDLGWLDEYAEESTPNTVLSNERTLDRLQIGLNGEEGCFYTRFGDADLFFIQDPEFQRNKRHDPNPLMSEELTRAFMIEDPKYHIGCVAGGKVFNYDGELREVAERFHSNKTFYSAVALHDAYVNNPDRFEDFVRSCFHGRKVLFVGGRAVARNPLVRKIFNIQTVIETTDRNAYSTLDGKMSAIQYHAPRHDVVIGALGQATRCLAGRLWFSGFQDLKFFDVGSVVDALAERELRSWIRKNGEMVHEYRKRFSAD